MLVREYLAEFIKHMRISFLVYDIDTKCFVPKSSGKVPLEGITVPLEDLATSSLDDLLNPTHHGAESASSVIFVELPLEKHTFGFGPRAISHFATWIWKGQPQSLFEANRTSTTGSLLCSKDRYSILFETPDDCVPYLHLSLSGGEVQGGGRQWRAILAYEKTGGWREHDLKRHKSCIETHTYTRDEPGTMEVTPFDAFASVIHGFLSQYISMIEGEAKELMRAIQAVEFSLVFEQRPSNLRRELNSIGRKIRVSSLKKQFAFSIDAAEWMTEISAPPDPSDSHRSPQFDLLLSARRMEQYHPDRLRETVSEIHQHIDDIIAESQQERQEELQLRQDARAKEEWDILQKNLKIAEATLRDSRLMSGVAWITMAFLPATFVSSFFGMNFFSGKAGYPPFDEGSKNVWIFFLVALPITAVVLGGFWYWNRQEKKKDDSKLKSVEEGATKNQDGATTGQSTGNDVEMPSTVNSNP